MKKHFEQAIAFDRDNPLNQRVGLGKKYNELVDEYNALEAKFEEALAGIEEEEIDETQESTDDQPSENPVEEPVQEEPATEEAPAENKSAKAKTNKRG